LVNSLSVVSPYGPPEKQALLEAVTLASRADMLIAMTEVVLAHGNDKETPLQ
ncbi:MAG: peptidase S16, partial [Pseudomonadota bacterium]|nr:peptidase S16 [Pseudomonadota bacterium]